MLSEKAVERLREVQQHILAEPNRLIMSDWCKYGQSVKDKLSGFDDVIEVNPPCGTAACIAGWVCLLDPDWNRNHMPNGYQANEILGLECDSSDRIYQVCNWPVRLQKKFATTNLRQRAQAASEAIDLFILGGGAFPEWSLP